MDRKFKTDSLRGLGWNFAWKDDENRFYIIDRSGEGFPVIRVVTFNIKNRP